MTFEEFITSVRKTFPDITPAREEMFRQLGPLYEDWNSKINVISRKDIDGLYSHHVLHSLAIAAYMKLEMPDIFMKLSDPGSCVRMLDIGTGGGFPGIPLAILFPGGRFTLCDSVGKKIKVASAVAETIGLENVTTVNARAESLQETFDFIVSRAVTSIENFLPWTRKKFSEGIFYLKGGDIAEELGTAMQKFRITPGTVHTWKIDSWLHDSYFYGKMVIFFEGPNFLRK